MDLDILATLFDRRNKRVTHSEVYMTRSEIEKLRRLTADIILTRARKNYERNNSNDEAKEGYNK